MDIYTNLHLVEKRRGFSLVSNITCMCVVGACGSSGDEVSNGMAMATVLASNKGVVEQCGGAHSEDSNSEVVSVFATDSVANNSGVNLYNNMMYHGEVDQYQKQKRIHFIDFLGVGAS